MILLSLNVCLVKLNIFLIQLCWSEVILTFEASLGAAYEIKQECDCPPLAREIEKRSRYTSRVIVPCIRYAMVRM